MRIFVTDKYRIATFLMICALIGTAAFCARNYDSRETAAAVRKLPIYNVSRGDGKIAVTFDCAWGADDIDSIIQTLKKHNCQSTFFVVGTWAEKYPESVKKLAKAGHEIGNHSYSHTYYTNLSEDEIADDLKKCNDAVKNACGSVPSLFRAPAGEYNNTVISVSEKLSMPCIQWDADTLASLGKPQYSGIRTSEKPVIPCSGMAGFSDVSVFVCVTNIFSNFRKHPQE